MESNQNDIIFEHHFPANISREKQLILLDLIEKTVELTETVYPIDGIKRGKLIRMNLKKLEDNIIHMSGFYNIGRENRCLEGEIYLYNNKIYIDSLITRLGGIPSSDRKVYRILDKFTILKTKINHETLCGSELIKNSYPIIRETVKIK